MGFLIPYHASTLKTVISIDWVVFVLSFFAEITDSAGFVIKNILSWKIP